MAHEYLVSKIGNRWHVSVSDFIHGPFVSEFAAEMAAVQLAKQDFRFGVAAKVTIDGDVSQVVYDNQTPVIDRH